MSDTNNNKQRQNSINSTSNNNNSHITPQQLTSEQQFQADKEEMQRESFFETQEQIAFSFVRELIPNLQLLKMTFLQRVDVPLTKEEEQVVLGEKNENHMASIRQLIKNEQTVIKTAADLQKQGKLQFQTAADTGGSLFEELQLISQSRVRPTGVEETPEQEFSSNLTCVVLGRLQNMIQRITEEVSLRWDAESHVRKEKSVPMDRMVDAVKFQRRELDQMRAQRDKLKKENDKLTSDLESTKFRLKRMTEHRYEDYSKFFKELQQVRRSKDQPRDNELFVVDNVVNDNAATAHRIGAHHGNIRLLEVPLSVIVQHGDPDAKVPTNFGGKKQHNNNNNNNSSSQSQHQEDQQQQNNLEKNNSVSSLKQEASVFDEQQDDTLLSFEDMAASLKRSVELENQLADFKFVEAMGIQNSGELISTLQHHQKRSQQMEDRNSKLSMQVDKLQQKIEVMKNKSNLVDQSTDIEGLEEEKVDGEVQTEGQLSLVAENGVNAETETEITLMDTLTIIRNNTVTENNNNRNSEEDTEASSPASLNATLSSTTGNNNTTTTQHGDTKIMSEKEWIQLQKPETTESNTQTWHAAFKHSEVQASVQTQDAEASATVQMFDNETQDDFYKIEIAEKEKDLKRATTYHNVVKEDIRIEKTDDQIGQEQQLLLSSAQLIRHHGCSEESPVEKDLFAPCELGDAILMRLHGCDAEEPRYLEYWTPIEGTRHDEVIDSNNPENSSMRTNLIRDLDHEDGKNVGQFIRVGKEGERHEAADSQEEVEIIRMHGCSTEGTRTKDLDADGKEVVDLSHLKTIPIPNECNGEDYRKLEPTEGFEIVRFHNCDKEEIRQSSVLADREEDQLLKPMNELSPESGRKLDAVVNEERFYDEASESHRQRQEDLAQQQEIRRAEHEAKKVREREDNMLKSRVLSEYRRQLEEEKTKNRQNIEVQTDPISFARPSSGGSGLPLRPQSAATMSSTTSSSRQMLKNINDITSGNNNNTSSRVSTVSGFSDDDDENVNPIDRLHRESSSYHHNGKFADIGIQTDFVSSSKSMRRRNLALSADGSVGDFAKSSSLLGGSNLLSSGEYNGNEEEFVDHEDDTELGRLRNALLTIRRVFNQQQQKQQVSDDKQHSNLNNDTTAFENNSNSINSSPVPTSTSLPHQHHHDSSAVIHTIPYFSATRAHREHYNQQLRESMSSTAKASRRRSAEIAKRNIESLNVAASKLDDAVLGAAQGVILPAIEFLEKAMDASFIVNSALGDIYENSFVKDVQMQEAFEEAAAATSAAADGNSSSSAQQQQRHLVTGRDYSMLARARRNRKVAEAEVQCWNAMNQVQSTFTKVSRELHDLEIEFGAIGNTPKIGSSSSSSEGQKVASSSPRVAAFSPKKTHLVAETKNQLGPLSTTTNLKNEVKPSTITTSLATTPQPRFVNHHHASSPSPVSGSTPLFNPVITNCSDDLSKTTGTKKDTTHTVSILDRASAKTPPPSTIYNPRVAHHLPPLSEAEMQKDHLQYFGLHSPSTNKKSASAATFTPVASSLGDKIRGPVGNEVSTTDAAATTAPQQATIIGVTRKQTKQQQSPQKTPLKSPGKMAAGIDRNEASDLGFAMVGIAAGGRSADEGKDLFRSSSPQQIRSMMKKRLEQ